MRARSIKPGICDNEVLGTADPFYTLLFERLWMMADREGRLEDRPLKIKAQAFPYRDGMDVEPMLAWLTENGFIARYVVGTCKYIQILAFSKHQNPHKHEASSVIPQMSESLPPMAVEQPPIKEAAGLTPSSLTPDSGLLTPHSLTPDPRPPAAQVAETEIREFVKAIKAEYPKGNGRLDWLTAERHLRNRLEEGETRDVILAGIQRYAAWCNATEKIGTQFVLAPQKFFCAEDRPWRQEWELPREAPKKVYKTKYELASEALGETKDVGFG